MSKRRGAGEGSSHYDEGRRLWVGEISLGWDERGRRRRKKVYAKTEAAVRDRMLAIRSSAAAGVPTVTNERLTVATFLDGWLTTIRPSLRATTYASYESVVRLHLAPIGRIRLSKLQPGDVSKLLAAKMAVGSSATTVRYIRSVLRIALTAAMRQGLLVRNVASLATAPRPVRGEVNPLTPDEARSLLAAAEEASDPLYPVFLLALSTGMRRGELLGLQWADLDLDGGWLSIRRTITNGPDGQKLLSEPKTSAGRRRIAIPAPVADALRRHRLAHLEARLAAGPRWKDEGWVFASIVGTPLEPRDVSRGFGEAARRAGITRRVWLHLARHSVASYLIAAGASSKAIQDQLGHVDIGTTLGIYGHLFEQARRSNADSIGDVLFPKAAER